MQKLTFILLLSIYANVCIAQTTVQSVNQKAVLSWTTEQTNIDHYNVYSSLSSGFVCDASNLLISITETTYTDESVLTGKTYFYKVFAVNADGVESQIGDEVSVQIESGQVILPGMVMDFNDGTTDKWVNNGANEGINNDHNTFTLSNEDNTLKVVYDRTDESNEWNQLQYVMNPLIDPSSDPKITFKYKSDGDVKLMVSVFYENDANFYETKDVVGDGEWHDMEFNLTNYEETALQVMYFYFDPGSKVANSANVNFDDIIIGSEEIKLVVNNLKSNVNETAVDLSWGVNFPGSTKEFKVYRGLSEDFVCDETSLVATTERGFYSETGLESSKTYYYKVAAVDYNDVEFDVNTTKIRTYISTGSLYVDIASVNKRSFKLYELFEADIILVDADYDNSYNPEEIDLSAVFTSPSGKEWNIFGYYDNYKNVNQWKVRFSPNEEGEWTYILNAKDRSGATDVSDTYTFTAISSDNKGWIKVSDNNPRYFEHDNGESFYGVGAYYPWPQANVLTMLDSLQNCGANMWALMNMPYDNGTIFESKESGLGRYDQKQAGWLDFLLNESAKRGLKMQYAIWVHRVIAKTVWGLAMWDSHNPYSEIMDVKDFFTDEEGWEYQKKQFRYLIARYAAYESFAIWELVNEISGTDAWELGNGKYGSGLEWVDKMNKYFKENDPYNHPTTASQHGGAAQYWPEGYAKVDVSNVHLYDKGWPMKYISNVVRSGMYNYAKVTADMWKDNEQPAYMGEAGFMEEHSYIAPPSDEYTEYYHNALWSTWANGAAATPNWWELNESSIMYKGIMLQMEAFAKIYKEIDYVNQSVKPVNASSQNSDVYVMMADTLGFGWMREINGGDVKGEDATIIGIADGIYEIIWYDTWNGKVFKTNEAVASGGSITITVPSSLIPAKDRAFILDLKIGSTGVDDFKTDSFKLITYPNPSSGVTTINYTLPESADVDVSIYNMRGQVVATLVKGKQMQGNNRVVWNRENQMAGIYVCKVQAGSNVQTSKIVLNK